MVLKLEVKTSFGAKQGRLASIFGHEICSLQPEKCNKKLCGVESSPFCLFAVGFLSTTPTCHSHGVTSRSCVFLEEGVSQKGWAFVLVWNSKCHIPSRNRHRMQGWPGMCKHLQICSGTCTFPRTLLCMTWAAKLFHRLPSRWRMKRLSLINLQGC